MKCAKCNGYGSADGLPCGTWARDFGPDAPGPCKSCGGTGEGPTPCGVPDCAGALCADLEDCHAAKLQREAVAHALEQPLTQLVGPEAYMPEVLAKCTRATSLAVSNLQREVERLRALALEREAICAAATPTEQAMIDQLAGGVTRVFKRAFNREKARVFRVLMDAFRADALTRDDEKSPGLRHAANVIEAFVLTELETGAQP